VLLQVPPRGLVAIAVEVARGETHRAAADDDPPVGRQPVVADEVASILDPLASLPADRRELLVAQRLGRNHVGERGRLQAAELLEEVRVGVGSERELSRRHRSGGRQEPIRLVAAGALATARTGDPLGHPHAAPQRNGSLLANQPRGVYEYQPGLPHRPQIPLGVDHLPRFLGPDPGDAFEAQ
jgi:hypothetical protein